MPENSKPTPAAASSMVQTISMSELDPATGVEGGRGERAVSGRLGAPGELGTVLGSVRVRLSVCVGMAEMTVGQLLDARAQQVFRLDRTVDDPVDILLDGQVVARGTLVAVDEHFAVRITEVPVAADGAARKQAQ